MKIVRLAFHNLDTRIAWSAHKKVNSPIETQLGGSWGLSILYLITDKTILSKSNDFSPDICSKWPFLFYFLPLVNKNSISMYTMGKEAQHFPHIFVILLIFHLDTLFMNKTAEIPYPLGPHIPI